MTNVTAQQTSDSIFVKDVQLIGHKKTKPGVVFREMLFGKGDYIAIKDLEKVISETYANLMNTRLFASIDIRYKDWSASNNEVIFEVEIVETWYIYPVPVFRLADRNFNVWWKENNRDINRVNLGLKFTHYNFTGRRDKMRLRFQYGYTRRYGVSYNLPYLGKQGNIGMSFSANLSRRREQNYRTLDNRQIFYSNGNDFVYQKWDAMLGLSYRRKLYLKHQVRLTYRNDMIADSIAILNPNFFRNGRTKQRFFQLEYEWTNDRRDVRQYPWKGSFVRFRVTKDGLGIFNERDGLALRTDLRKYTPLGEKYSLNTSLTIKYSPIRSQQPFLENRAIGFDDASMAGYQFYVVDGLDMLLLRTGLRRKLFNGNITLPKLVFIEAFRSIPWRILLSTQLDQGIANDPYNQSQNRLANKWLVGGSIGLDLVLYYDMTFGFQYQRNQLGESNFLLQLDFNL